jgi:hypothetical protein
LGNLDKVFELGEAGLDLAKEIQSLPEEAFIRWQIGMGYEACGETEKAKDEMKQAIDIEAQINSLQLEKHQEYFQKFEAGN